MKTNLILLSTLFSALIITSSCEKMDDLDCERCGDREQSVPEITNNDPCQLDSTYYFPLPAPNPDEFICHVIQDGWFIDRATNACIEAEYSSCFGMGFASLAECEQCKPCQLNESHFLGYNPYPSDTLMISCHAYFETWFIDRTTNDCVKSGYSACEPSGFATEAECVKCKPCPVLNDQHYLHFFFDEHSQVSDTLPCYTSFTSWFIDGETNQCVEYEYGHCMELGFPSFEECEKCKPVQN